jgi:hypothetical protein
MGSPDHQAPREHNLDSLYDQVDVRAKAEGWSVEYTEEVKVEVARKVQRNEALYEREQRDVMERVVVKADEMGDRLTDPSQLGADFYRLSPTNQLQVKDMIRAKNDPSNLKPNGEVALAIEAMRVDPKQRDAFLALDPRVLAVTPAERASIQKAQAEFREEAETGKYANNDTAIGETINRWALEIGIDPSQKNRPGRHRERYLALARLMDSRLKRITGGKRAPTDAEVKGAFDYATMTLVQDGDEVRRFEVDTSPGKKATVAVPVAVKNRIIADAVARGRPVPSREEIARIYVAGLGRPGVFE